MGAVPRVLWLAAAALALLVGVYALGHHRGAVAGELAAKAQLVEDSLEHNADELRPAAAHTDSARRHAAAAETASARTTGQYQAARQRVVVVDDSTVIDERVQRALAAPAVVQLVRTADAMKVQDSITIQAERGRAAAAEAELALWKTRAGLLEEKLAITEQAHAPVIGRRTGLVLGTLVVLDAAVRILRR